MVIFPATTGTNLVCAWNNSTDSWVRNHYILETNGVVEFNIPSWNDWYWVGVWEVDTGSYVCGRWMGHFLVDFPETIASGIPIPGGTNDPPDVVITLPTDPYPPRKKVDGGICRVEMGSIAWDMTFVTSEPRLFSVYHTEDLLLDEWVVVASNRFYEWRHNNPSGFYKVVLEPPQPVKVIIEECYTCLYALGLPEHDPTLTRKDLPDYQPQWNAPYIFSELMTDGNGNVYRLLTGGVEDEGYANAPIGHGWVISEVVL
jgi:hypothetical protein